MTEETKKQPKACPAKPFGEARVAIVCDWLTNWGGAERCDMLLHEMWPEAPIYSLIYNEKKMPEFKNADIRTSYLNRAPLAKKKWQFYLHYMPCAIEQFDLTEYDIVITTSHSCAKGVITKPSTLNICYLYSPTRYMLDFYYQYLRNIKFTPIKFFDKILKNIVRAKIHDLRQWDFIAARRPDYIISISQYIRRRAQKYYRIDSDVIYPPVNCKHYLPANESEIGDYYLIVGRQIDYKRHDIVIEAFNQLGLPLVIIGEGPELKKLKKIAKSDKIKFMGRISDAEITEYFAKCIAMIHPQEEDFGITPLEAQSAGRPVIAYRAGGAMETVVENETGVFFDEQTPEAVMEIIKNFDHKKFNSHKIREHALKFDTEVFKRNIKKYVEDKYQEHLERNKKWN
ncbi:MAG: glycosyltransferase [Patescibacteria group bacterium]|nr:glycosyltransferase [Patescibacteria group bacterium]